MQNPTEYAPVLFTLAQDEAKRQATLAAVDNATKEGLAHADVLDSLTRQMNADRADAFVTLMSSLIDVAGTRAGSGQVPVSITIDVYNAEIGSVTSTALVRMYHPIIDEHPNVDGLALAAPDGVYDDATLRIHAAVDGDDDVEALDAIYATGEVEVHAGHITRWVQREFNTGGDGYTRPVDLDEWSRRVIARLFPIA